jgi:hypothetical protein
MEVSGQVHTPGKSSRYPLYTRLVGPRAGLNSPCRGSNSGRPSRSHYIDRDISADVYVSGHKSVSESLQRQLTCMSPESEAVSCTKLSSLCTSVKSCRNSSVWSISTTETEDFFSIFLQFFLLSSTCFLENSENIVHSVKFGCINSTGAAYNKKSKYPSSIQHLSCLTFS